jgi:hypothetical protein
VPLADVYQHHHIVVAILASMDSLEVAFLKALLPLEFTEFADGRNYWVHKLPSLVFIIADVVDVLSGFDRLLGYQLWIVDSNCHLG